MLVILVLVGGAIGAFWGPIGAVLGAGFVATLANSLLDVEGELLEDDAADGIMAVLVPDHLHDSFHINPATGLPMIDGNIGGFDVGGNPYGMDLHDDLDSDCSISTGSELMCNDNEWL